MDPQDSIADTVASMNYKWVKDSWVSQNHPTVDNSTDKSTFVRSDLDTVRKEQVRKMAKLLDDYKSPAQRVSSRRLLDHEEEKSILLPQAASSPKSDTFAIRANNIRGHATPTMTHRSMSPTPTSNQTVSWRKHSMRPSSANGSRSTELVEPPLSSVTSATVHTSSKPDLPAKHDVDTNFRPVHVTQIEDSYWRPSEPRKEQLQSSEITPSPSRYQHQQFYTAKQFGPASSDSRVVESLRVTSPDLHQSPSVRPAASIAALELLEADSCHDLSQQIVDSKLSGPHERDLGHERLTFGYQTDRATQGDLTRLSSSAGSELSKVDSQATSLQKAISSALMSGPQRRREDSNQFDNLPLEDAIVARYRHSRLDRSHTSTAAHNTHHIGDVEALHLAPKESTGQVVEPLKHASPLLGRHTPTGMRSSAQAESTEASLAQHYSTISKGHHIDAIDRTYQAPDMYDLIGTLEKVTAECSRRGNLIDALVEKIDAPSPITTQSHIQALHESEKKAQALEKQLSQYQTQMDQMYENLRILQMSAEQHTGRASEEHPIVANLSANQISRDQYSSGRRSNPDLLQVDSRGPLTSVIVEESFQDKIERWNHGSDSAQMLNPQLTADPLARAKQMLSETPAILQEIRASASKDEVPGRATSADHVPQVKVWRPITSSPEHISVLENSHRNRCANQERLGPVQNLVHTAAEPEQHNRRVPLEVASTPREPIVKPLTADMMPDARDAHVCTEHKLYSRLRLSEIDTLTQNEAGNLLKNILIQLDIPYENLSSTITALGAKLTFDDDQVHNDLIQEALKLRGFAENVHATLYAGDHIEGIVTSRRCLNEMHGRIAKLQRASVRRKSTRSKE